MRIEEIILSNVLHNAEYAKKTLPFIKREYFQDPTEQIIFNKVVSFIGKYKDLPTKETLLLEFDKDSEVNEVAFEKVTKFLNDTVYEEKNPEWLIKNTEEFCQEKALYNAIMKSITIIDDQDNLLGKGAIPDLLTKALAVSFDNNVGHDFLEDAESRYDFYNKEESKVPFDLEYFNKITKGGLPNKSLNCALAGSGVGKTLLMTHMASGNLMDGKNVLYITLEMAEERIAERIDANLLNISMEDLTKFDKKLYDDKMVALRKKTGGKLIIKEYPTASVGPDHFRHLLNELHLKKNFRPDIVYIDYINICTSSRVKYGANVNSYTLVKSIAEELRGLAVEQNIPIMTATQLNRSGFTNSDPGMEDVSESFGLAATVDMMFAMVTSDELESMNQILIKQLKNRYNDPTANKRFVVGVDRSKMRLYDTEQSSQEDIVDDSVAKVQTQSHDRKDFSKLFN